MLSDINTIFHKRLCELRGVTPVNASAIVRSCDVFRSVPRGRGNAISYTYLMALVIRVGSDLMNLGVSQRMVNVVLADVSSLLNKEVFDYLIGECRKTRHILCVFFRDPALHYPFENPVTSRDLVTGYEIALGPRKRLRTVQAMLVPEEQYVPAFVELIGTHIRLDFSEAVKDVDQVFK